MTDFKMLIQHRTKFAQTLDYVKRSYAHYWPHTVIFYDLAVNVNYLTLKQFKNQNLRQKFPYKNPKDYSKPNVHLAP